MQQNCVDEILNREYTELNETEAVIDETKRIIEVEVSPVVCQPFDCNGNGRCVNGTCVCDSGTLLHCDFFILFVYLLKTLHVYV